MEPYEKLDGNPLTRRKVRNSMATKKKSIKSQLESAQKEVADKGVLMSKKEREELLGLVPTKKNKITKKKKVTKKK